MAVDILLSYAPSDREAALELERHLTPLRRAKKINLWHRGLSQDAPDEEWRTRAESAAVILLLVSSDLDIDRDDDINQALEQRQRRGARVVPIMWRSVNTNDLRYKELRRIPDGRAVRDRSDRDQAWVEVVQDIRRVVESIETDGGLRPPAPSAQVSPAAKPAAAVPANRPLKVLFLGANPADTTKLRLDTEVREMDRRILMGRHRDRFELNQAWAVTVTELSQTLLRYQPGIVHFSGHGTADGEILLQDERGDSAPVPGEVLARLLRLFVSKGLRCVVLNACYSEAQARAIAQNVDCVIGISGATKDKDAVAFAAGFYTGLAEGETVAGAFELGCIQIALTQLSTIDQPKLFCRPGVDSASLRLL